MAKRKTRSGTGDRLGWIGAARGAGPGAITKRLALRVDVGCTLRSGAKLARTMEQKPVLFADEWFQIYRQRLIRWQWVRRLRFRIRVWNWRARRRVLHEIRRARRLAGELVPETMKNRIWQLLGLSSRSSRGARGHAVSSSARESDKRRDSTLTLEKSEYERLVKDAAYWRKQAQALLEELEYVKSLQSDG